MRVGVGVEQILPKYIKCMYTHWIKYCDNAVHIDAIQARHTLTNISKMIDSTVLILSGVLKLRSLNPIGTNQRSEVENSRSQQHRIVQRLMKQKLYYLRVSCPHSQVDSSGASQPK
jgi:hypothetical protein